MDIALITSEKSAERLHSQIELLEEDVKGKVQVYSNYDLAQELLKRKFHGIIIRADYLKAPSITSLMGEEHKHYVGKMVLTEIVRKVNSPNISTLTVVQSLFGFDEKGEYSAASFIEAGANITYKGTSAHQKTREYFRAHLPQHS